MFSPRCYRGGYKYLPINNLHNIRSGFGFKTAPPSCPDGFSRSGAAGVFSTSNQYQS